MNDLIRSLFVGYLFHDEHQQLYLSTPTDPIYTNHSFNLSKLSNHTSLYTPPYTFFMQRSHDSTEHFQLRQLLRFILLLLIVCVGRAQKKLEELYGQLEIAKLNFQQLGGVLAEDKKKLKEEKEHTRYK